MEALGEAAVLAAAVRREDGNMNKLNTYIENLKTVFASSLKSVFIYGSSANNNADSNINLMVIVDEVGGEELKKCSKFTKDWMRAHNPLPIFISLCAWKYSNDTYAMEYSDIKDSHEIVFGENFIDEISVNRCDLRLQCECETKNLLMRLRGFYLQNAHSNNCLKTPLIPAIKTLMAIFRAVLRLKDIKIPNDDADIIKLACEQSKIMPETFLEILRYKKKECRIKNVSLEVIYNTIFKQISILLGYINSL